MAKRGELPVEEHHVGQRHLDRVIMLSDGVFAIAITLSAIELHPELVEGHGLWEAWARPLLLYLISFVLTGGVWLSHRRMFAHLRDINVVGTALNLLLLACVALLPVAIRFSLEHMQARPQVMQVYFTATGATYVSAALLWAYLAFVAHLAPDLDRRIALSWLLRLLMAPALIAAAGLLHAGLNVAASVLALVAVALAVGRRWAARGAPADGAAAPDR
ncbi:TMEM175 family protein [Dyella sp.]|uniref:TMEM175 family protein n=1 Tax=Dyella sp. TaxID=1869338 RepID=UPI002D77DCCA|nr:TMEM175 family protein [Dyella sp.]HET6432950.1 TMEM175 family protein [Dyella sp.]